jgi:hypothetical protein
VAKIVVCGYMVRYPIAGNILAYFHYVLGLHRLGHQVTYLEESGWPYSCYHPTSRTWQQYPDAGLGIVRGLLADYDLPVQLCYVDRESGQAEGASRDEIEAILRSADLLLNIGGVNWLPEFALCPRRVLVDMDPLFTQVGQFGGKLLGQHHVHFSYGLNIGTAGCSIPTGGVKWWPLLPPVVLDLWSGASLSPDGPFTTVANWNAYGGITYEGSYYGQKSDEFLRILDLPSYTSQKLEIALSGASAAVVQQLRAAGWSVREASEGVSDQVSNYKSYILGSRGEFSVAKHAYVTTRSGWFSDRSVCYLAAELPVVLQDTGFSNQLPTGRGVLPFSTLQEAADCLQKVNADYEAHRRAAREIAEEMFNYRVVLPRLLDVALDMVSHVPQAGEPGGAL